MYLHRLGVWILDDYKDTKTFGVRESLINNNSICGDFGHNQMQLQSVRSIAWIFAVYEVIDIEILC